MARPCFICTRLARLPFTGWIIRRHLDRAYARAQQAQVSP
jgi:hypothetical protein